MARRLKMDKDQLKEYMIRVTYTEIITEEHDKIKIVEAYSEEEAMDMIRDVLYEDYDEIDNISYYVFSEKSCSPGHRDDKTVDMFKK